MNNHKSCYITNTSAFQVDTVTDADSNIYQTTRYHNTEYEMSTKYQSNGKIPSCFLKWNTVTQSHSYNFDFVLFVLMLM